MPKNPDKRLRMQTTQRVCQTVRSAFWGQRVHRMSCFSPNVSIPAQCSCFSTHASGPFVLKHTFKHMLASKHTVACHQNAQHAQTCVRAAAISRRQHIAALLIAGSQVWTAGAAVAGLDIKETYDSAAGKTQRGRECGCNMCCYNVFKENRYVHT